MKKGAFGKSIATKISAITLAIILISTAAVGIFSYVIYKSVAAENHAERALAIAESVAASVDPEKYEQIMAAKEKDNYWDTLFKQICDIKELTDVDYLYIIDREYDTQILTFMEAQKPTDPSGPIDFYGGEDVNAYADEMFKALETGETQITGLYYAEGYGMMVGGYCPIINGKGEVIAVVGVDVVANAVIKDANEFGLKLILIVLFVIISTVWIPIIFVRKKVRKPLNDLCAVSDMLAVGDLRTDIPDIKSGDEVGDLARSFKNMLESTREQVNSLKQLADGDLSVVHSKRSEYDDMSLSMIHLTERLNEMLGEINKAAEHVAQGARQIADSSQHLAQSASEQTTSVEMLTDATYRLYDKTHKNAEKADAAAGLTQEIEKTAKTGSEQMEKMILAVGAINEANKSIEKVMKAIDDIAFQTNILALNAAVEAARAGQHGKGFAVVADEVRALAAKSAEAASESAALISNSVEKAKLGASIAQDTSESLNRIASGIRESTGLVAQIAEASSGQSADIDELRKGIEQMSGTVHQNSSAAEESAATCEEMSGQSDMLNGLVSRFKLK